MTTVKKAAKGKKKADKSNYDSAWKDIIKTLFKQFLEFFFPLVHDAIDFSRGVTFLDKELNEIDPDSVLGDRRADVLAKVFLKDGSTNYVCIYAHLEVESKPGDNFMERMYIYNYRAYDKKKKKKVPVISLTILTDENVNLRPDEYVISLLGFELRMKIPIVKIIDYKLKKELIEKLETSTNPMALVVKAQLMSYDVKRKGGRSRFEVMKELMRQCYQNGYSREFVKILNRFFEWIIRVPKSYEKQIKVELKKLEEEFKMPYLASYERSAMKRGEERGIERGIEQTRKETAMRMLEDGLPIETISRYTGLSTGDIVELKRSSKIH